MASKRWGTALAVGLLASGPLHGAAGGDGSALHESRTLAARSLPAVGGELWRPLALPRVPKHTRYEQSIVDGRAVVHAQSECAASGLAVALAPDAIEQTPVLRWRWRVDDAADVADEQTRPGDDFAARVYVMFRFEPERATLSQRLKQSAAELIAGEELPGRAVTYVWTRRVPAGRSWPNPFTDQSRMISMGPAESGVWRTAQVDVLADYVRHFDAPPPEALGLAIMTDTDNSCTQASAWFADFELAPRAGDAAADESRP